jgi:hypothetical protein
MTPEAFDLIAKVLQLGMSGVLLALLNKLWGAFDEQNKFIRELLVQAQKDREAIANAVGITLSRPHEPPSP